MKKIIIRAVMALFAVLYLFIHFAPRAHAHEGIDHSGETAQHDILVLGDIEIANAFARATLPNAPVGGGFMTITNTGAEDDRLIGAAADVAGDAQIHEMALDGDIMKMRALEDGIALPAGETVTLAPGGLHIMFMGIEQPFVEGECVEVRLTFEKAGEVGFCMPVAAVAANGADHSSHGSH
ncbi:copper chaperone PCu(A)C [Devosia nitrariae]|uniref:Copper chaperone PCu(A)C n=1 Tax=Devosia nitrariae TaxID=2071872 RepID=A0ABQ5W2U6_9HYPH|nr:copper chaperone PCu(A)C [Devosia nitrariae]GLQ54407.1 hypothetical protein GCM10010862_16660 [Devosia nitrariae]